MRLLKQFDTLRPIVWLMVDSTDHISPKTGLSPSVVISKNGGSFAAPTGTITEIGNGWYKLTPTATDVNTLGPLLVHATATGADPVDVEYQVVAYDPYSSTNLGLSNLDTTISSRADGAYYTADRAAKIDLISAIIAGTGQVVSDSQNDATKFKVSLSATSTLKYTGFFLKFFDAAAAANEIREIVLHDPTTGLIYVNKSFSTVPQANDQFILFGYSGR